MGGADAGSGPARPPDQGTDGENQSAEQGEPAVRNGLFRTLLTRGRALVPPFVRRRYTVKFAISVLVVFLVIASIGTASYVQIRESLREDTRDEIRSRVTVQAESLSGWVKQMQTQTRLISSDPRLQDGSQVQLSSVLLQTRTRTTLSVQGIHLVNTSRGTVPASSAPNFTEGTSVSVVQDPWVETVGDALTAPASSVVVTNDVTYQRDGVEVLAFASRVPNTERVIVVIASLRSQTESLEGADAQTVIVNSNNRTVLAPEQGPTAPYVNARGFERAVDDGRVTVSQGPTELRAFAPVEKVDWVVVTTIDNRQAFAIANSVGRNVLFLVTASLVVLVVVAGLLGYQTVVPLQRLRSTAEQMADGDLDVELSTRREDEIGRLYATLDYMRVSLRDQIREAQEARREVEASNTELERQNERLDQFASTLSHDLRNPLAVARGHIELLATLAAESDRIAASTVDDHLTSLTTSHERIETIIEDVLTLTREGETVEETQPVALDQLAHEAWGHIDNKAATIQVETTETIQADRTRLLRAVENLFRNAIDHAGSDVTVTVGSTDDGFYVEDDGPGIPAGQGTKIFEYGHSSSEDGTGLGLSIVKTIVEAHGWRIEVESGSDGGARFLITEVAETDDEFADLPEQVAEFDWSEEHTEN
jgi:two-component system OmpR family sensor kinase